MTYRSFADLHEDIIRWIPQLPTDIELVVGIPRSGLLVANLLSLHLNIPMADLNGFLAGKILSSGKRLKKINPDTFLSIPRKVLVVDDAIGGGTQMNNARLRIRKMPSSHEIVYGALYVATFEQLHKLDYSLQYLPHPGFFEWNLFHHILLKNSCMDIDGVLCRDPYDYEDDDSKIYEQFLRTVKPIRIPTVRIGWLVTCRLEKYRALTVDWLERNSIRYNHLVMMNYPDKKSRQRAGLHSSFKAEVFKMSKTKLFIESSKIQAEEIAILTGKYVYCSSTHDLIYPSALGQLREKIKDEIQKTYTYPGFRLRSFLKLLRWWLIRK